MSSEIRRSTEEKEISFVHYFEIKVLEPDTIFVKCNAKQKHPKCKKSKAKSEAPVSSYSYMRLKSVISGGGQGPSCLLATMYGQLHINLTFRKFSLSHYRCATV